MQYHGRHEKYIKSNPYVCSSLLLCTPNSSCTQRSEQTENVVTCYTGRKKMLECFLHKRGKDGLRIKRDAAFTRETYVVSQKNIRHGPFQSFYSLFTFTLEVQLTISFPFSYSISLKSLQKHKKEMYIFYPYFGSDRPWKKSCVYSLGIYLNLVIAMS